MKWKDVKYFSSVSSDTWGKRLVTCEAIGTIMKVGEKRRSLKTFLVLDQRLTVNKRIYGRERYECYLETGRLMMLSIISL